MKPIRYIYRQDTIWYNLADYTQLLLDTHVILPTRQSLPSKGQRHPTPISKVLLSKLNRLKPVYRLQINGEVYVDWVVFERFYPFIKPFLVHPTDWKNPASLFREIQRFIDHPQRYSQASESARSATFFEELTMELPI